MAKSLDQLRAEVESRLRYIRIKIKDGEEEMAYLGRCFNHLENKSNLSDKGKKQRHKILRKLASLNQELSEFWDEEEVIVGMQKAHSEGRSYFPIVEGPATVGKLTFSNLLT